MGTGDFTAAGRPTIGLSHDGVILLPKPECRQWLIFPIVSLYPGEKTNLNKKAF